ncbi:MAG TPA: HAMP domain-containing sensor histidine kinase [Bacteroidales bacterium]|nr:HAMP domain-containing sensor histidine kinase [Bacteroidales bacterium]
MKTFFAPAQRADKSSVERDFGTFRTFEHLGDIINGLPYIALILNQQRQLVFTNQYLVDLLGANSIHDLLGLRPGELMNCVNAYENEGGCGTSENCRYCGAVNAIMECLISGERAQGECRITSRSPDGGEISYDFFVTASPFRYKDQEFVILSFNDISNEKRRKVLERLFFHDILNTAGGLRGFLEFLKTFPDDKDKEELLGIAMSLSDQMIDEIVAQRELLAAEQGELMPRPETVYAGKMLENIKQHIEHHPVSSEKKVRIVAPQHHDMLITDPVLLRRILLNMTKNAVEASKPGNEVTLSFHTEELNKSITFNVHNAGEIPPDVRAQIFQRSFSTKGSSRGVGTYSIKLLGEKYLGGKVDFTSTSDEGTNFSITLPLAY